jgi:hypothetical protein
MDTAYKIVFEDNLGNMFNEIWLVRILCDLWHNYLFDPDNIKPGMMFKFYHTNADGSAGNLNSYFTEWGDPNDDTIHFLKWIDEPHIVTKVRLGRFGMPRNVSGEMHFQPVWLGNKRWSDKWKIFRRGSDSYVYYDECALAINLRSVE